ncbi:MAG TPA: cytochrome c [Thermoanaerobaculia bacterium]|nr:cytochrome c [Thermoanaerobaculia bacterium]
MKQTLGFTLSILVAVFLLAVLYSGPASGAAAPDGKTIFLAQKCNMCHNVPAARIERTVKSEKMAGPDLVNIKVDAATLGKVLRRQADVNGKKHPKEFKGTDEELNAVVSWILSQKK